jgi:hypothetical protein
MKIMSESFVIANLLNYAFQYVINTSKKFNIDESHALKHSMEVYRFSKRIYESELVIHPYLESQKEIIYMCAIGHDMCDKKYMDESQGILEYKQYLSKQLTLEQLEIMGKIISSMSYSKVKANGYPTDLSEYELAYHIVREADLLAAYDIDRCIMYKMYKDNLLYSDAFQNALDLFDKRVFLMIPDDLFITEYSKKKALQLHKKAEKDVENLKHF